MTTIYITLAVIILWLVGVDVRYYQINKKIKIMHNTDKNILELIKSNQELTNEKKKENKSESKRNNTKRIIKKSKRVRAPKVSS